VVRRRPSQPAGPSGRRRGDGRSSLRTVGAWSRRAATWGRRDGSRGLGRTRSGLDVVLLPVATGDPELDLTAFVVHEWEGDPQNLAPEEHERIAWFDADGCRRLPLSDPRLLPVLLRGLAS
jgi:hypothetical protein